MRTRVVRRKRMQVVGAGVSSLALLLAAGCSSGGDSADESASTPTAAGPATAPNTSPGASSQPSDSDAAAGSTDSGSGTTGADSTGVVEPSGITITAPGCTASKVLGSMTLEQQLGQLFMTATPASGEGSSTALNQIAQYKIGNVFLGGRSSAGASATAGVSSSLQNKAKSSGLPGMLVATDQEGGKVQVLKGSGFSTIPSALTQGGWATGTLRTNAKTWGSQLRSAGVNTNLAPVLDTVPSAAAAPGNAPIGAFQREYGYTPQVVADKGGAFQAGMTDAGIATTVKHFPGLGLVKNNTDTTANVHDTQTTTTHPYIGPFRAAVKAGTPLVMVSSAYYDKIDKANPAMFSPAVYALLRKDLGFKGVVISDELGAAKSATSWTPAQRATKFFGAGGDILLVGEPNALKAMYTSYLAAAKSNPALATQIRTSALRVLSLKQKMGLLKC